MKIVNFESFLETEVMANVIAGLEEVAAECKSLNIEYHLLIGDGEKVLPGFMERNKMGALVLDFMPLRDCLSWADLLKRSLPKDVPLCQASSLFISVLLSQVYI